MPATLLVRADEVIELATGGPGRPAASWLPPACGQAARPGGVLQVTASSSAMTSATTTNTAPATTRILRLRKPSAPHEAACAPHVGRNSVLSLTLNVSRTDLFQSAIHL